MNYVRNKKYEDRERLKKGEAFDKAELENIKAERSALKTKATLRSEKKSLKTEKFESSTVGRAYGFLKSKRKKSTKKSGFKKPRSNKKLPKVSTSKPEINEAFSLGGSGMGKKKRFFYE